MGRRARALAAVLLLAAPAARAQAPVPALTGPVVDAAGLLRPAEVERLSGLARSARAREGGEGVQLQYLLVRSLEGEPIEDFSIRAAEAWKLGSSAADNGLLVTVAVEDRAFRIEVGGGLEGEVPDALARRVGDRVLVPAFRAGRFADGLYDAGAELLTLAGVAPEEVQQHVRRRATTGRVPSRFGAIAALLFVLWIMSNIFRGFGPRRRRHLWWGGGPFIGGGGLGGFGGGGFGGGGGWSGGGGGFSGGGASGRW